MKFKEGVILTQNGDETILVAAGEAGKHFSGIMKLNATAAEIGEMLQKETDVPTMAKILKDRYGISRELALESVEKTVKTFCDSKIVEE